MLLCFVLVLYYINGMCVLYPNCCMSMCVVFYICTYISSGREDRQLPTTQRVNHKSINQSISNCQNSCIPWTHSHCPAMIAHKLNSFYYIYHSYVHQITIHAH